MNIISLEWILYFFSQVFQVSSDGPSSLVKCLWDFPLLYWLVPLPLPSFRFNCTGFDLVRKAPTWLMSVYFAAGRPAFSRSEKLGRMCGVSRTASTQRRLFPEGQILILHFIFLSAVVLLIPFLFCSLSMLFSFYYSYFSFTPFIPPKTKISMQEKITSQPQVTYFPKTN